jgi:hypothetical protein
MLRTVLAVTVFGLVHSALAADRTKHWFARRAGERRRNAYYRPIYNAVAVTSTGALIAYVGKQQSRVYEIRGPLRYAMLAVQGLAAVELMRGLSAIGLLAFLGFRTVEVEGQGPSQQGGSLRIEGPFQYSRHPVNALTTFTKRHAYCVAMASRTKPIVMEGSRSWYEGQSHGRTTAEQFIYQIFLRSLPTHPVVSVY